MSDNTSDIPIPGEPSKPWRVLWKGTLIREYDTEEELRADLDKLEVLIEAKAGAVPPEDDRKYEIFQGNKLIEVRELQSGAGVNR
jgi:hypothetical protein